MPEPPASGTAAELAGVRRRGVRLIGTLFWAASVLFVLIAGNAYLSIVQSWLDHLARARTMFGIPYPGGPDWLLIAGLALAIVVPAAALWLIYLRYTRALRERIEDTWAGTPHARRFTHIERLPAVAGERRTARAAEYMRALANAPGWKGSLELETGGDAAAYRASAARVLAKIEDDVSGRALASGLVVGLSRHRVLDLLTIASAALELQLHVLGRLGKKPGLRTWAELWKRTAASLFLNTYLNREEAWEVSLAVKKAAMGLQATAEAADYAGDWLENLDTDEYLDSLPDEGLYKLLKAGTDVLLSSSSMALGVGAAGVKQISILVDRYGEDILEGILAGSILYYHGMAIAADCLALDRVHRAAPEMNRTVREGASRISGYAGRLVRRQVRDFRAALIEKRKQAAGAIAGRLKQAPGRTWESASRGARRGWDKLTSKGHPEPEPEPPEQQ